MVRFNNSVRPQTRSQSQSIMDVHSETLRCDSECDILSMPALSPASSIGLDTESNASPSQVIAQSPVAVQNTLDPNLSLPYDYQCSEDEIDSAFSTAQCIATDTRPSFTTDVRPLTLLPTKIWMLDGLMELRTHRILIQTLISLIPF